MAAPKKAAPKAEKTMVVQGLTANRVVVWLLGTSAVILHAMSAKAGQSLLIGGGKKTKAEKVDIKHHPYEEYRASAYTHDSDDTRLCFPAGGLRKAISTAALETGGTTKSQVQRIMWIDEYNVPIWGVPQIYMAVVRNSDMARTPDVRTRCIVQQWCTRFTINYITPTLNEGTVAQLIGNAGLVVGIGDNRQEKGAGSNGQFTIVKPDDPRVVKLLKDGGTKVQDDALADPAPYDKETVQFLSYYNNEVARRKGGAA